MLAMLYVRFCFLRDVSVGFVLGVGLNFLYDGSMVFAIMECIG